VIRRRMSVPLNALANAMPWCVHPDHDRAPGWQWVRKAGDLVSGLWGSARRLGERLAGVDTAGGARVRQTQAVHPTDKDDIVHGEPPGASLPPV
jgi:hypothetical protein